MSRATDSAADGGTASPAPTRPAGRAHTPSRHPRPAGRSVVRERPVAGPSGEGRAVLVTGCSSGLGLATAVALARDGWHVFATMRDLARRDALDRAASGLSGLEVLQLDVTDSDSLDRAVADVGSRTGGTLYAVVHNAGVAAGAFFEDSSADELRRAMDTNFFGVTELTRRVLPMMRAGMAGRVVVVSSVGAFMPPPALSAYAASKWAVEGWCESLAVELGPFGIIVSLVEPGTFRTGIWSVPVETRPESPYQDWVRAMGPRVQRMVARLGRDPAEVGARIAAILAEPCPRLRNPVGPDSWVMRVASGILPFRVRALLLRRVTGGPRVPRRRR